MTAQSSIASSGFAVQLDRLGRQLLLVPEAPILFVLLSLYYGWGAGLSLATLALFVALWFGLRMGLLVGARRAFEQGNYARAATLAQWAVSLYPYSADALGMLGMAHLADGRIGDAVKQLQRATVYYPWQPGLHTALATALLEAGYARAAHATVQHALRLEPTYGPAYLALADAEMHLGASDERVEALLRQGLQNHPAPVDAAAMECSLAACLLRRNATDAARQALRTAEQLLPATPPLPRAGLHFQLGELWRTLGDFDTARNHFAASADLDPHGPHAATAWRAART